MFGISLKTVYRVEGAKISQNPNPTKSTPAPIFIAFGGIHLDMTAPPITPRSDVRIKAPAAPKKTAKRELLSAAKQKVASWVLSPSSARNIIPNVVNNTLRSM